MATKVSNPPSTPQAALAAPVSSATSKRVFGADLMRAIAILIVIIPHGLNAFSTPIHNRLGQVGLLGGTMGVEIFFVLSGFLIGSILLSLAPDFNNIRVLPSFWLRRWFRTLPNYYLFIIINIVLILLLFPKQTIPNIAPYLVFSQNWLWPNPLGFFQEAWSLAVEEWFYLLFPISLFLIYRLSKSFTTAFLLSAVIFIIIPTLVRVQMAFMPNLINWDENFRKVMFIRLDAIMYGVLAAWIKKRFLANWIKFRIPFLVIGSLILFFTWLFALQQTFNTSFFAKTFLFSLISIGVACTLPVCDQWTISKENVLTRLIRSIALWSYSMYLSNLLIVRVFIYIRPKIPPHPFLVDVIFFILFYVICAAISAVIYTYFEKPTTALREKFTATKNATGSHAA